MKKPNMKEKAVNQYSVLDILYSLETLLITYILPKQNPVYNF